MATEAAVAGHAPAEAHAEPNYIAIFIYLAVLTGIELVIYAAGFPQVAKVSLLIALAWAKAVLVAMYFMHLRFERGANTAVTFLLLTVAAKCSGSPLESEAVIGI